jgi:hypothetical protein
VDFLSVRNRHGLFGLAGTLRSQFNPPNAVANLYLTSRNPVSGPYAVKDGRRYRYYVSTGRDRTAGVKRWFLGHFDTNPNSTSKFPITFPGAARVDSRCKFEIRNCGGTRWQFRNCSGQGVNRPPFKMAEKTYFL